MESEERQIKKARAQMEHYLTMQQCVAELINKFDQKYMVIEK
jgi:hypothetical protein